MEATQEVPTQDDIRQIKALLAKAASTQFPAEAVVFRAGAYRLMAKYGVDEQGRSTRDPVVEEPVEPPFWEREEVTPPWTPTPGSWRSDPPPPSEPTPPSEPRPTPPSRPVRHASGVGWFIVFVVGILLLGVFGGFMWVQSSLAGQSSYGNGDTSSYGWGSQAWGDPVASASPATSSNIAYPYPTTTTVTRGTSPDEIAIGTPIPDDIALDVVHCGTGCPGLVWMGGSTLRNGWGYSTNPACTSDCTRLVWNNHVSGWWYTFKYVKPACGPNSAADC